MQIKVPCKDCQDRHPGCHSECDKYKQFKENVDKKNAIEREQKDLDYAIRRGGNKWR